MNLEAWLNRGVHELCPCKRGQPPISKVGREIKLLTSLSVVGMSVLLYWVCNLHYLRYFCSGENGSIRDRKSNGTRDNGSRHTAASTQLSRMYQSLPPSRRVRSRSRERSIPSSPTLKSPRSARRPPIPLNIRTELTHVSSRSVSPSLPRDEATHDLI